MYKNVRKIICFLFVGVITFNLSADPLYKSFTIDDKTVNRWVNITENAIYNYDSNNNLIYEENTAKYKSIKFHEYDEKNRIIHTKFIYDPETYDIWYTYFEKISPQIPSPATRYLFETSAV